ncbi:hypothetical protein KQX54_021804 [Cotesia glomerata]|uniref:Uncharacterized protein n=1 Tax=Cotesia glomerata TaxID=32391 RepID=A0AAV7J983_COTGL|nr:hypothetical protein KQX54_021804 [Cotesia glomerata]
MNTRVMPFRSTYMPPGLGHRSRELGVGRRETGDLASGFSVTQEGSDGWRSEYRKGVGKVLCIIGAVSCSRDALENVGKCSWLPDAPNIIFNDINFLLNGPRFDSRLREERGEADRALALDHKPRDLSSHNGSSNGHSPVLNLSKTAGSGSIGEPSGSEGAASHRSHDDEDEDDNLSDDLEDDNEKDEVVLLRGLAFYTDVNMRCGMWVNLVTSPSQIDIIIFMAISSQLRKRKREEKFWAADVDDDA